MAKRTFREIFLDTLEDMSGNGKKWVGNIALRDALGWDKERYDSIKGQLVDEKIILIARGQGGSVCPAEAKGIPATTLFISYSHADATLERELVKHLEPLKRLGQIAIWHDLELKAGDEWDKTIARNLENADIILLLISVDFLNSAFCYDNELQKAMERHGVGDARVIPIILRSCLWKHSIFSKLQALPQYGKAITSFSDHDSAFADVAEAIRQVVLDIRERDE
jgi:hypothetical protein